MTGRLSFTALARLHRPTDEPGLRRAAEQFHRLGYSDRDIGELMELSPAAVRQLLKIEEGGEGVESASKPTLQPLKNKGFSRASVLRKG